MNESVKESSVITLFKGQVLNKSAEALGRGPWWLLVIVILATSLMAAFPFVNERFSQALRSTNPALYPDLESVFQAMLDQNWNVSVEKGVLVTGPGVPAQTRVGPWLVVFEPAGGDPTILQQALASSGTTVLKVAYFGRSHFGLLDQETKSQFDGTWEKLSGFRSEDLKKIPPTKLLPILLYAAATGGVVPQMFAVLGLMFVQVVFLAVVLGFLLGLSKVHIAGTHVSQRRAAGYLASMKTAGFVSLGPALLTCLLMSSIPGASSLTWVAFSLLYGVRIMVLYMARFRNKPRT